MQKSLRFNPIAKTLLITLFLTSIFSFSKLSAQTSSCDSLSAYFLVSNTGNAFTFTGSTSAHNPKGYLGTWKFGDGTTATAGLPETHTFPASYSAVTYDVCFYVSLPNSTCGRDSLCRSITVPVTLFPPCDSLTAAYTYTAGTGSGVDEYSFTSGTNPSGVSNTWNFGDGTTGSGSPVSHTFPTSSAAANYNVCHYVYFSGSGCKTDTVCKEITVAAKTSCDSLSAYYLYSDTGASYLFSNTYAENPKGYVGTWKFGDGKTATAGLPETHTFPASYSAVTYDVCFYVSLPNSSCGKDSLCRSITVPATLYPPCDSLTAAYTYTAGTGSGVDGYTFTSASNPTGVSNTWNFGDGTTGSGTPVSHTFPASPAAVNYNVCHYVYFSGSGCKTDTVCKEITVAAKTSCDSLSAYYDYEDTGASYLFSDPYLTNPHGYQGHWKFGDGTTATAGVPETHTFPASYSAVTYDVCFYVSLPNSTCGTDSFCRSITVPVTIYPPCDSLTANYTYTNTLNAYSFTSATNPAGYRSTWNFGDGTTGSGSPVSHTFPGEAGPVTYTVCHYVYFPGASCKTDTSCSQITVAGVGTCNANYTYTIGTGGSVSFTSTSTASDSIKSYYWILGDGSPSVTTKDPTHTYAASGSYRVCLYISTTSGCESEKCDTITVSVPCNLNAAFQYDIHAPEVSIYASQYGTNLTSYWSFGDGTTATTNSSGFSHYYPSTLDTTSYNVCHIVYETSNTTCRPDTSCLTIKVPGVGTCNSNFTYLIGNRGTVTFTNESTSSDSITHWSWSFGDGTTSDTKTPTHTYTISGSYQVCLSIESTTGCTAGICDSIKVTVPIPPCDSLTAYYYYAGSANSYTFTTATNPAGYHDYWNFGDGSSIASGSPIAHTFPTSTDTITYTVCNYVYYPGATCRTDTFCRQITVPGLNIGTCNAGYTWTAGTNGSVKFNSTSTSSDSITLYYWSFGDGTTSTTTKDPTHDYSASGSYRVCLYIKSITGCESDKCDTITVTVTTSPCDSLNAYYYYTSSANAYTFTSGTNPSGYHSIWNFGDGTTGSGSPESHTFPNSGDTITYTVCHYVYLPNTTCKTDTFCRQITVPGTKVGTCNANYSYILSPGPGTISFTSTSTSSDSIISYYWSFGDGTTSSTTKDPTHTFAASGSYRVCLYIKTSAGCESDKCDTISVTLPCNLSAAFNYDIHTTWVSFYPTQIGTTIRALWIFGDGTTSTDSAAWITHTFPASLDTIAYNVCHIVYSPNTSCKPDTVCMVIKVPGIGSCNASFTETIGTGGAVAFVSTSSSSDSIVKYTWTFGDGGTSDNNAPTHTYTATGRFYVCLTITSLTGCSSTVCDSITITGAKPCNINSDYEYTHTGNAYTFTAVSNPTTIHQYWTFGDGSTGSGSPVSHTYATSADSVTYTVCHVIYLPGTVCIDTTCMQITVPGSNIGTCHADYAATITQGLVSFTNTSTSSDSVVSWNWYFGDGSTSDLNSPTHTYTASGTYYACLRQYTVSGCLSYHCDSIHITLNSSSCNSAFTWALTGCDTVSFLNLSTGGYTHTAWNFGDGTSSGDASPVHIFSPGTWTVTLYVYSPNTSCDASTSQTITVTPCSSLLDTLCGVVFSDNNGNGVLDSGDAPLANTEIHVDSNILYTDSFGHYLIVLPAGSHIIYALIPSGCIATIPLSYNGNVYSYYTVNGAAGGNFCGYNFGIDCSVDHICGTVFYDANNNGRQDSGEAGVANVEIIITPTGGGTVHHAYTNTAGEYCETVPAGTYTVTLGPNNYSSCTIAPASITVDATGSGQSNVGNAFAIYCPPGEGNLSVQVTPNSSVTPGYPAWYTIQVCNVGLSVMSGVATFYYDPSILTYNYSLPPQNGTGPNSVSFNVTSLEPGACVYFWSAFTATSPLTPAEAVYSIAVVTPDSGFADANPANNIDTLHQEVETSWDPNSKTAYQTNYSSPAYQLVSAVNPNQNIEYTINFENDGNADAVNIVVDDNLSPDLDPNSFRMIASSSPCTVTRNGNLLNVKFSNIMLPPASVNEQGSHGYVKYSINSVDGLPAGHIISDPATVYFDYNAPVTTDPANVIMLDNTGISEVKSAAIIIGPNPMSDYTQVTLQGSNPDAFRFRVTDMTGRVVTEQISTGNTLTFSRNNLAAGVYIYQVIQNNVVVNIGKLVVE